MNETASPPSAPPRVQPQAPRPPSAHNLKLIVVTVILLVVLAVIGVVSAIIIATRQPDELSKLSTNDRTDTGNGFSITVPKAFSPLPEEWTAPGAAYAQGDGAKEQYITVVKENTQDFEASFTAQQYADLCYETFSADDSMRVARRTALAKHVIDNPHAYTVSDYKIEGSAAGIRVVYLIRYAKTKDDFYQVITWTLPSKYQQNEAILKNMIRSFNVSTDVENQT